MSSPNLPRDLAQALAFHKAGRLEEAAAAYRGILSNEPKNVDALHLLSTLHLQKGDAHEAIRYADEVIALNPDVADAHGNKGSALQSLERFGEAAFALRTALKLAPDAAHLHYNLGNALRADGDKPGAVAAYRQAVSINPALVPAHSNLGATLSELGLFDEAAMHCRQAIEQAPEFADAHYNLGNALREAGQLADAVTAYRTALRHDPAHGDTFCNLGLTMMATADLDTAITIFADGLKADPTHHMARFYQAVAIEMSGAVTDETFDRLPTDDTMVAAWLDSWQYVKSQSDMRTEIIHQPFDLLGHALTIAEVDGLALEFGVRHGCSTRHIARKCGQALHGFDSFHGLPSAWGGEPEGVYSTGGALPDVPANVTLHPGLFEDTLAPFLATHLGPVRFANIDCDLYGSTKTVLDALAPRVVQGTVFVFDEYLINPTWRDDEFKAFQEAVATYGWRYSYVAFGIVTKQAAVRIDAI